MYAKLIVISGRDAGKEYELLPGKPIKIGRGADDDIVIFDQSVSRTHSQVWIDGDEGWFQTLKGQKGLFH